MEKEEISTEERLRRELEARDEALFDLQATLASIQAETSHQIAEAQALTQAQVRQLKEELRRAQQEANLAQSRANHWQQKAQQQQEPANETGPAGSRSIVAVPKTQIPSTFPPPIAFARQPRISSPDGGSHDSNTDHSKSSNDLNNGKHAKSIQNGTNGTNDHDSATVHSSTTNKYNHEDTKVAVPFNKQPQQQQQQQHYQQLHQQYLNQQRQSNQILIQSPGARLVQHILDTVDLNRLDSCASLHQYVSFVLSNDKYIQKQDVCLYLMQHCMQQTHQQQTNVTATSNSMLYDESSCCVSGWTWLLNALDNSPEVCRWLLRLFQNTQSNARSVAASLPAASCRNRVRIKNVAEETNVLFQRRFSILSKSMQDPLWTGCSPQTMIDSLQDDDESMNNITLQICRNFLNKCHEIITKKRDHQPDQQEDTVSVDLRTTLVLQTINVLFSNNCDNYGKIVISNEVKEWMLLVTSALIPAWCRQVNKSLDKVESLSEPKFKIPRRMIEVASINDDTINDDSGPEINYDKTSNTNITAADDSNSLHSHGGSNTETAALCEDIVHDWLEHSLTFLRLSWKCTSSSNLHAWMESINNYSRLLMCCVCDLIQYYIWSKPDLHGSPLALACIQFLQTLLTNPSTLHTLRLKIATTASTATHWDRAPSAIDIISKYVYIIVLWQQSDDHLSKNLLPYNQLVPIRDACICFIDSLLRLVTQHRLAMDEPIEKSKHTSSIGDKTEILASIQPALFREHKLNFSQVVVEFRSLYASVLKMLLCTPRVSACQVSSQVKCMIQLQIEEMRLDRDEELEEAKENLG